MPDNEIVLCVRARARPPEPAEDLYEIVIRREGIEVRALRFFENGVGFLDVMN